VVCPGDLDTSSSGIAVLIDADPIERDGRNVLAEVGVGLGGRIEVTDGAMFVTLEKCGVRSVRARWRPQPGAASRAAGVSGLLSIARDLEHALRCTHLIVGSCDIVRSGALR
jgi:hypothetical protein